MKRIMIIGCCGSGKSTLSRQLQKVTGLPLYHLDQYYWKPNWTETPIDKWTQIVRDLADKEEWIIDGNYGGTMDIRMQRTDTIIYLDVPTVKCLWRVLGRIRKYHGQVRPDMPDGCKERLDFEFLHYVATYNLLRKKTILKKLKLLETDKTIITLRNNKDIEDFLLQLKEKSLHKS